MDMAQMMERLLATINADREDRKADKEEMKANQERSDANRKTDKEQMLAAMKANQEMTARMEASIGSMQAELKAPSKT
jgi:hypothetical protein